QRCGPVRQHAIMKGIELIGTVQGNSGNFVCFRKQQLIGHNALTPGEKSALCLRAIIAYSWAWAYADTPMTARVQDCKTASGCAYLWGKRYCEVSEVTSIRKDVLWDNCTIA